LHPRIRRVLGYVSFASPWASDEILREEIFSIERLEQHAASLATAEGATARPAFRRSLRGRLRNNKSVLLAAYRAIATAVDEGRSITPAAEWLLDNFHLVEEQIREIREALPPGYYRQLPILASGPFKGYPRVFGLAWAFVAHNDSRFEPETLRRFVQAYQTVQPLTIGELWAVAITLRIVLIENLRRAAQRIVSSREARQQADSVADRLLGVNGQKPQPEALFVRRFQTAPLSSPFAVQLVLRLRDQDPRVTPALLWLEERLAAQGTTADEMVRNEHQRQGASNVTMRNIITSMRLMSDVEWAEFFESVSLVDAALRSGSDFAAMDFATRNLYRSAIEDLARNSKLTELETAQLALRSSGEGAGPRERDPGYHLMAAGRRTFESAVGYRPSIWRWPRRIILGAGIGHYMAAIALAGAAILAIPLQLLRSGGVHGPFIVWHDSGDRCGCGAGESSSHATIRRNYSAGSRAARWRASRSSNAHRRARTADPLRCHRRANRTA
jgi:cyclic beta-1,2-glucan synthetase